MRLKKERQRKREIPPPPPPKTDITNVNYVTRRARFPTRFDFNVNGLPIYRVFFSSALKNQPSKASRVKSASEDLEKLNFDLNVSLLQ